MALEELTYEQVAALSSGKDFDFKTTGDLEPLKEIIGQDRAVQALEFGLSMRHVGYNIFVAGYPGGGRKHVIERFLQQRAPREPAPPDWVYVHNFENPDRPLALRLDAGVGAAFADAVEKAIHKLAHDIPKLFESESYSSRRKSATQQFREKRDQIQEGLTEKIRKYDLSIQQTPLGVGIIPLNEKGQPMKPDEFEALPEQQQQEIQEKQQNAQGEIDATMRRLRKLDAEIHDTIDELDKQVTRELVDEHLSPLCTEFSRFDRVCKHISNMINDIVDNIPLFRQSGADDSDSPAAAGGVQQALLARMQGDHQLDRYKVNVFISNDPKGGAPIVEELNPTYPNMFGRIERRYTFGALMTDFTMIKAGSLHRANGGYLIMDAIDILMRPGSWDALKRAVLTHQIAMEDLAHALGYGYTETLQPEPIQMEAKIILIGSPLVYTLLYQLDDDFRNIIKVKAEFSRDMPRSHDHLAQLARFVRRQGDEYQLLPLDASAVAEVANYGSRMLEDRQKLSTQFTQMTDILLEADHWARKARASVITAKHVERAIEERVYRSNLAEEKLQEAIDRGLLLIDTSGTRVGQINGLSVYQIGDYEFGLPSRVTASTHLGSAGVVHIERRSEMSGHIHTKGVETITGLLGERFCQDRPLALEARLTFEQSYGGVEGDSASAAEYYALVSSLAKVPITQSVAITGSMNQKGDSQPIGGVTKKVEGFYDVCRILGAKGRQGVLIPRSNAQNLVLRGDVLEAVRKGKFHIWVMDNVDDGVELLMDLPAGTQQPDGSWTEGSLNRKVDDQLKQYAEAARHYGVTSKDDDQNDPDATKPGKCCE